MTWRAGLAWVEREGARTFSMVTVSQGVEDFPGGAKPFPEKPACHPASHGSLRWGPCHLPVTCPRPNPGEPQLYGFPASSRQWYQRLSPQPHTTGLAHAPGWTCWTCLRGWSPVNLEGDQQGRLGKVGAPALGLEGRVTNPAPPSAEAPPVAAAGIPPPNLPLASSATQSLGEMALPPSWAPPPKQGCRLGSSGSREGRELLWYRPALEAHGVVSTEPGRPHTAPALLVMAV